MSSFSTPARIVVVDDHPIVRERLADLLVLEQGIVICGEADCRRQALEVIAATNPDLVIVDLSLKNSHGLDLIKDIRQLHPKLLILVLSMHDGALHAGRAIRAGAHGFITKQEASRKILIAIRKVLEGGTYLEPALSERISSQLLGNRNRTSRDGIDRLTDQELRVLEMLGRGFAIRQIAENMQINVKTVETYRARIREKLALRDSTEVLRYAIEWIHTGGTDGA